MICIKGTKLASRMQEITITCIPKLIQLSFDCSRFDLISKYTFKGYTLTVKYQQSLNSF